MYFWRSDTDGEIDYIEERDGILYTFEFNQENRNLNMIKVPKRFRENYKDYDFKVIDKYNFIEFI